MGISVTAVILLLLLAALGYCARVLAVRYRRKREYLQILARRIEKQRALGEWTNEDTIKAVVEWANSK